PTVSGERHAADDLRIPGVREPSAGRRRDAPAVRVGEVNREDEPRRPLDLAHDAGVVVHRTVGGALAQKDLPAGTRLELGYRHAEHLRPPPLLQMLRLCEHIEDTPAPPVE